MRPPSPRTEFTAPTLIPFANTLHRMWGDDESGRVPDWIFISGNKLHQMLFRLAPRQAFKHSADYRTYFAADVVYVVLAGSLVLINPETGEAQHASVGEIVFFRRDTWHHGFNDSDTTLTVLEYLAPPPAQGTTSAYARDKPLPSGIRYADDRVLGNLGAGRAGESGASSIHVVSDKDAVLRVEGLHERVPVRLFASTEHLTVGRFRLLPGQTGPIHEHGGDEGLYVHQGTLLVWAAGTDTDWFEVKPGDAFYVPEGVAHRYLNQSDESVDVVFGIAPAYLPR